MNTVVALLVLLVLSVQANSSQRDSLIAKRAELIELIAKRDRCLKHIDSINNLEKNSTPSYLIPSRISYADSMVVADTSMNNCPCVRQLSENLDTIMFMNINASIWSKTGYVTGGWLTLPTFSSILPWVDDLSMRKFSGENEFFNHRNILIEKALDSVYTINPQFKKLQDSLGVFIVGYYKVRRQSFPYLDREKKRFIIYKPFFPVLKNLYLQSSEYAELKRLAVQQCHKNHNDSVQQMQKTYDDSVYIADKPHNDSVETIKSLVESVCSNYATIKSINEKLEEDKKVAAISGLYDKNLRYTLTKDRLREESDLHNNLRAYTKYTGKKFNSNLCN